MIFWLLTIIVCLKYLVFVLRADNKGEGGILALMALVHRVGSARLKSIAAVSFLGVLGASLLFSDGIITPSISVLSAVEGLSAVTPAFGPYIIPLSLLILGGIFALQPFGTSRIGAIFGPVLLVWFLTIATLGIASIVKYPAILASLNPAYAVSLAASLGWKSVLLLATAFLAVTGAEVLYADMGHFGKSPIRAVWFSVVYPALILNYLGQGAHLLHDPAAVANLFYRLAPPFFLVPLIVIATIATIIASQAVLSGMFSLAKQAVQLGFWPRIRVVHTSTANPGQVFIPFVNMALFCCTLFLVLNFKHSGNLAAAYGIAVSATMLITTALLLLLSGSHWQKLRFAVVPVFSAFLLLDVALFAGNLSKLSSGGAVVAALSIGIVLLMTSWIRGRALLRKKVEADALPLEAFIADIAAHPQARIGGTAVFLSGSAHCTPRALLHNYKHNRALHERVIVLSVLTEEIPLVSPENRAAVFDMGCGIFRLHLRFGFMETPDVPSVLRTMTIAGRGVDPMLVSYFLGKELLVLSGALPMLNWRKRIFLFLSRNATSASAFFNLPPNRVVEFGSQIEF